MFLQKLFFTFVLTQLVLAIPPNDKALFADGPESRIHRKKRPCRGRSNEGRTFFDWSLQYVDVNYNHNTNYNINCGGGGGNNPHGGGGSNYGGGGPQKPILSGIFQGGGNQGGGGGPQKPILSGIAQGVGNVLSDSVQEAGGPVNFVQAQVQGIVTGGQNLLQGIGSILPQDAVSNGGGLGSLFQNGLFNGQGISSLFENGLFSGIFDNNRPSNNPPPRPPPSVPNRPLLPTTTKPDAVDPDDIIYNDEIPVHEDHDDILPDNYNRPAPYYAYNRRRPQPRPYPYQSRSSRIRFS